MKASTRALNEGVQEFEKARAKAEREAREREPRVDVRAEGLDVEPVSGPIHRRVDGERPSGLPRALLVSVDFGRSDAAASLEELTLLVRSAGAAPFATITGKRQSPDATTFIGSGKVDEIAARVVDDAVDLVVFDHALSPAQQRNLERRLQINVVDRTALILDIFAQRAQSHDGKVQVELAQLSHLATRLVRGWTHLERQKGGIGMRGPGETQLESDRRLIGDRVKALKIKLEKLGRQRATQRRARSRGASITIALVGYTNAGKSTLFNALTHGDSFAADQLFATLDTTSRRLYLEGVGQIVLSDTVGFIRELPHSLIEAFKATLEETAHADVLLHVVDVASPQRSEQIAQVNAVLAEIGAAAIPQIVVFNKIDAVDLPASVERDARDNIRRVSLSAKTGVGLSELRSALVEAASTIREAREKGASAPVRPGPAVSRRTGQDPRSPSLQRLIKRRAPVQPPLANPAPTAGREARLPSKPLIPHLRCRLL